MKPRWKITLILLCPVLLILSGIYLRLFLDAKRAHVVHEEYYRRVARPAIDALNADRLAVKAAGDDNRLSGGGRTASMSAMIGHYRNREEYKERLSRNRVVGWLLFGLWAFASLVFVVGRFDREEVLGETIDDAAR